MMDLSEFGEAADFLRKSYTEQLKLQTIAFDGKISSTFEHGTCWSQGLSRPWPGLQSIPAPFPVLWTLVGSCSIILSRASHMLLQQWNPPTCSPALVLTGKKSEDQNNSVLVKGGSCFWQSLWCLRVEGNKVAVYLRLGKVPRRTEGASNACSTETDLSKALFPFHFGDKWGSS